MATQDTTQLKERIVSIIRTKGPSLPVHIAKGIEQSMLFTSAFLSELLSEKKLKTSNLRVGSSPLYLIKGQEQGIENFSNHLRSREKDAFILLKEKSFLKDSDQEPAIRVALRAIKDFAIPFKRNGEGHWRYFTVPENELEPKVEVVVGPKEDIEEKKNIENEEEIVEVMVEPKEDIEEKKDLEIEKEIIETEDIEEKLEGLASKGVPQIGVRTPNRGENLFETSSRPSNNQDEIVGGKKDLNIFDKPEKEKTIVKKKIIKKKASQKVNEKFFNVVKEYLAKKQIEILDIVGFSKVDLILRVRVSEGERLLIAYNKKSLREVDIVKAYKKAQEFGLKYFLLSFGAPLKKLSTFIDAVQGLEGIERIEK